MDQWFGIIVPVEIGSIKNFDTAKTKIKEWKPTTCSCRLCKTYVKGIGFIDISQHNAC